MIRIIDGLGRSSNHPSFDLSTAVAFKSHKTDSYRVKAVDIGNGHLEAIASRVSGWEELSWSPRKISKFLANKEKWPDHTPEELKLRSLENSARRAKTNIRRLCKVMRVDALMTLTYRGLQSDLGVCKRHLKEFARRVRRVLPGFQFVAGFEEQKRGAWHVHLATSGIPRTFDQPGPFGVPRSVKSYDLLRSIWRSVVKEYGGNIDLSRRNSRSRSSCAQIASYISKYITKAFSDGEKWSNRWAKYGDCEVPGMLDFGVFGSLREALEAMFGLLTPGQCVNQSFLPRFHDIFFLSAENGAFPPIGPC